MERFAFPPCHGCCMWRFVWDDSSGSSRCVPHVSCRARAWLGRAMSARTDSRELLALLPKCGVSANAQGRGGRVGAG